MGKNISVGDRLAVKPQCRSGECPLYEACQSDDGRKEIASKILKAVLYDEPDYLPDEVTRGRNLEKRPEDHSACMHLARLTIASYLPNSPEEVELAERALYWGVRHGFGKPTSINQPRE